MAALSAATADNSRLRQQLATQRDATAETIAALRDQHAALHATLAAQKRRVAALAAENRALRDAAGARHARGADNTEIARARRESDVLLSTRRRQSSGEMIHIRSELRQMRSELATATSDRAALRTVIARQRQRIDRLDASRAAADDALATVRAGFRDVVERVEELLYAIRPDSRSTLSKNGVAQRVSDVCTRIQALVQCVDAFHALFGRESERDNQYDDHHHDKHPLFTPVREHVLEHARLPDNSNASRRDKSDATVRHSYSVQCGGDGARISHHRAREYTAQLIDERLVPSADEIMPLDDAVPPRLVPRATRTRSLPFTNMRKSA